MGACNLSYIQRFDFVCVKCGAAVDGCLLTDIDGASMYAPPTSSWRFWFLDAPMSALFVFRTPLTSQTSIHRVQQYLLKLRKRYTGKDLCISRCRWIGAQVFYLFRFEAISFTCCSRGGYGIPIRM